MRSARLIALSDSVFQLKGRPYRLSFHLQQAQGAGEATLHTPRQKMALQRIEPWHPAAGELETYTGRYYSPELEPIYAFSVADSPVRRRAPLAR